MPLYIIDTDEGHSGWDVFGVLAIVVIVLLALAGKL